MTEDQAQKIADRVGATLVSVMRRLLGWPVRGRVGERVDAALAAGEPAPEASQR
jgi:hypothetical protein